MEISDKDLIRFMSKIKFFEKDKCWEWIGNKGYNGYGRFKLKRKMYFAHRLSYLISKGPIPKDLCVCHSCDVRHCINPDHLWIGTHADNMQDRDKKGRHNNGKKNNTHCPSGHEFSGDNVIIKKCSTGEFRVCRECKRLASKKHYFLYHEKEKQNRKDYMIKNKKRLSAYYKKYHQENKDEINAKARARYHQKKNGL